MRITACALLIAVTAFSAPLSGYAQRITAPASDVEIITVRLSNFAFEPEHLRLKAGVPVRLRLVNESNGGHDFSAPTFFATSTFLPGSSR